MLKRKIAGLALAVCVLGGLAIGWICRTRTWSHSFDMVLEASPRTLQRWLTGLALAALATAFSILCDVSARSEKCARATRWAVWLLPCLAGLFLWDAFGTTRLMYLAQECLIATYVLVCYAIARWTCEHIRPWGTARTTFVAVHLLIVILCGWDTRYGCFAFSLPTVTWMAIAFTLVYTTVFWQGFGELGTRHKLLRASCLVVAHMLVFSSARMVGIVRDLCDALSPEPHCDGMGWWTYHLDIMHIHATGAYSQVIDDAVALSHLPDFPAVWLGIAFDTWLQAAYVTLVILCIAVLWWLCRNGRQQNDAPCVGLLASGTLASNLWGLICCAGLFYSSRIGTLVSVNVFQLVPLALLALWALRPVKAEERTVVLEAPSRLTLGEPHVPELPPC